MDRLHRSLADVCRQPEFRSLWYQGLARRAVDIPVHDWLIAQANGRGFHGAFGVTQVASVDRSLSLEDIVVGLLAPSAPADGRTLKLVLRILQSGRIDTKLLLLLSKRERAEPMLYWLLQRIPAEERNEAIEQLRRCFATPPRGYRPVDYDYDSRRLIRRPASKGKLWRTQRNECS